MFSWASIQAVEPVEDTVDGQHPHTGQDHAEGRAGLVGPDMGETREAQETRLVEAYSKAVEAHVEGQYVPAKRAYQLLLDEPRVRDADVSDEMLFRVRYLGTKNFAELLEKEGKISEALDAFSRATDLDDGDAVVWLHLATLCEQQGFWRAARYAYERGPGPGPTASWDCLEGLARVLEVLGDWSACQSVLQRALRLDSNHPGLLELWFRVRRAWRRGSLPAAISRGGSRGLSNEDQSFDERDADGVRPCAFHAKEGVSEASAPTILPVTLEADGESHAWLDLGRALLQVQESCCPRPLKVEAEVVFRSPSSAPNGHADDAGKPLGQGRRTARVTEAERMQQVSAGKEGADSCFHQPECSESGQQTVRGESGGGLGNGAGASQERGKSSGPPPSSVENDKGDAPTPHISVSKARRASRRGGRTSKDEEGAGKGEERSSERVREWMEANIFHGTMRNRDQGESNPLSDQTGHALDWWSDWGVAASWTPAPVGEEGPRSPSPAGQGGMFHAVASDEGAELVMHRLRPFKGTHNSLCDVCLDGGELICCETCSLVYHTCCLHSPPGMSEALYCDRCREEAYRLDDRQPPRVADHALLVDEIEEITGNFLPSVHGNLGALDVMRRLVMRLARVREPRVWSDGRLRGVALALEEACRSFARDIKGHVHHDSEPRVLDFGPAVELFLAELHMDELLIVGSARKEAMVLSGEALEKYKKMDTKTADSNDVSSEMIRERRFERSRRWPSPGPDSCYHEAACDLFIAKTIEALGIQTKSKGEKENNVVSGRWEPLEVEGEEETEREEKDEEVIFSEIYRCRFAWLRALLAAWRGDAQDAERFLTECQGHLEEVAKPDGSISLSHCQRNPRISLEALGTKRKELLQRNESGATRELATAFRKGVLRNAGNGSLEATRAFLSLVRRRYLCVHSEDGKSGSDGAASGLQQQHVIDELLADFLEYEAKGLMDTLKRVGGRTFAAVGTFCGAMDRLDAALEKHSSILMITLITCAKADDLLTAVRILHQILWHLLFVDHWGDKVVASYHQSLPAALAAQARSDLTRLNVLLLETLSHLLAMALRGGCPPFLVLSGDLCDALPSTLASLLRFSSLPYSRVIMNAAMDIFKAVTRRDGCKTSTSLALESTIRPTYSSLVERLEETMFRSLSGILCDPQLEPGFLQDYTNSTNARDYLFLSLHHFSNLMDENSTWAVHPEQGIKQLTRQQLWALTCSLQNLARMASEKDSLYGKTLFPCYLAQTFLVLEHPLLQGNDPTSIQSIRLDWMILMHGVLAEIGQCGEEGGRFLKLVLKVTGLCTRTPTADGDESLWSEESNVFKASVQCMRCLYGLDLSPNGTVEGHHTKSREPEGLSETMGLATFVVRYLEEAQVTVQRRKQMLTALLLAFDKEPMLQQPEVCSGLFPLIESFLFRGTVELETSYLSGDPTSTANTSSVRGIGDSAALVALLNESERLTVTAMEETEAVTPEQSSKCSEMSMLHLEKVKENGVVDSDALIYVYSHFYTYLTELSNTPRFLKRKGQSEAEAYAEYEAANLDLLQMHFLDLRFNPNRLEAWLGLTERAWSLYLMYLDHCPAGVNEDVRERGDNDYDARNVVSCFEQALYQTRECVDEEPSQDAGKDSSLVSIAPFLDIAFFEDVSGTEQGARVCYALDVMGLKHLLKPKNCELGEEELDVYWAALVVAVYRLLASRCLETLDGILKHRLEKDPSDQELATKRIEARVRLAMISYMRRYHKSAMGPHDFSLKRKDPEHMAVIATALRDFQAAQSMESRYGVRSLRWDIPFMIGRLLEETGRARHGRLTSYAKIELLEPGWMESFLSQFKRAQELAERSGNKMSRKEAFYRLHATRLKAILSDIQQVAGVSSLLPPCAHMLQLLRRYSVRDGEGKAEATDIPQKDCSAEQLSRIRWALLMDAMKAMALCRRFDSFDHRSIYQRARVSEHLFVFWPEEGGTDIEGPIRDGIDGKQDLSIPMKKALASSTQGKKARFSLVAASDLMYRLFEKKRTQIVAVWLAEECNNVYDLLNQRNLKYEATRRRYITYYVDLLERTNDCDRLFELYRNVRTLKDPTNDLLSWTQSRILECLTMVLDSGLPCAREDKGACEGASETKLTEETNMRCFEITYEVYLDLAEAVASTSGRRGTWQRETDRLAEQRKSLFLKLENVLVRHHDKSIGAAGAEDMMEESPQIAKSKTRPTGGALSLATTLAFCHEKWPEKQGRLKLAKTSQADVVVKVIRKAKSHRDTELPVEGLAAPQQRKDQIELSQEAKIDCMAEGPGDEKVEGGSFKRRRIFDACEDAEVEQDQYVTALRRDTVIEFLLDEADEI